MVACAFSALFQNSGSAERASSSSMRRRLPSTSKMPPENGQPALQLGHAFSQGADFHGGTVYTIKTARRQRDEVSCSSLTVCREDEGEKRSGRFGEAVAAIVFFQPDVLG